MCLQYKPTVVACFCIHLSCKWSNWEIPLSNEKREWFYYVDKTVTADLLEQVTAEFLVIYEKYPTRLKNRINQGRQSGHANSAFEADMKKGASSLDLKDGPHPHMKAHHIEPKPGPSGQDDVHKRPSRPHDQTADQEKLYRQKKERERMASHQKPPIPGAPSSKHPLMHGSSHHRPSTDPNKLKPPPNNSRPSGGTNHLPPTSNRPNAGTTNSRSDREPIWVDTNLVKISARVDVANKGVTGGDGTNARPAHPADKQIDTSRSRPPDSKPPKHDLNRSKQFAKPPADADPKRHAVYSVQDKSSAFLPKPPNATSQRLKSPFGDIPKSVPTAQSLGKTETRNGNLSLPSLDEVGGLGRSARAEEARRLTPPPAPIVKKPSLFSPEQTTPPKRPKAPKTPPSAGQRLSDTPQLPVTGAVPPALSPFPPTPKASAVSSGRRNRTSSSGSEPELRPVVKKLDQMTGYENILRDSKMSIKVPKVPDIIQPIADLKADFQRPSLAKELKPPDLITPFSSGTLDKSLSQPLVNGIETNPAMISNLLKEAPAVPHLAVGGAVPAPAALEQKAEHHHKSEKKKKKEKHKHKDKSKSKEDKEKKKKHKDKEREKHKAAKAEREREESAPIKITIPKDKITPPEPAPGLKIKIPRDKLQKTEMAEVPPAGASLLKIKISKDQISGFDGRKRERDKGSPGAGPPAKAAKSGYGPRQNGRSSYPPPPKVSSNFGTHNSHSRPRAPPNRMIPPAYHPLPPTQPYFYTGYPPPPVAVPPPSMQVPPPYMYAADPAQMYSQFYPGYQMFHAPAPPQEMYQMVGGDAPPLPEGPPPNNPPPPPE